jgi:putative ABC transport system permease protein
MLWTNLLKQMKNHPAGLVVLLIGFVVGLLATSLGTSIAIDARTYSEDSTSGDPAHQGYLHMAPHEERALYSELVPILQEFSKNLQIQLGIDGAKVEGTSRDRLTVVGVMYQQRPEWQAPLLNGRHLLPSEASGKEPLVLVGKELANELFKDGMKSDASVTINGQSYHVIGVLGRQDRSTQWDSTIFMPLQAVPDTLQSTAQSQMGLFVSKNGGGPKEEVGQLQENLMRVDPNLQVVVDDLQQIQDQSDSSFFNSVVMTAVISGLVLFVASVNIANLSLFWVLDRRREIAIRKAIGATDQAVMGLLLSEMLVLAFLALLVAILLHVVLLPLFAHYGLAVHFHWSSVLVAGCVALLCGVITSISPVRAALRIEPAEILRAD